MMLLAGCPVLPPARLPRLLREKHRDSIHSFNPHSLAGALPGPGMVPGARNIEVIRAMASDRATHTPVLGTETPKPTYSKCAARLRRLLIRGQGGDVCLSSSRSPDHPSANDSFQAFSLRWARPLWHRQQEFRPLPSPLPPARLS